MASDLYAVLDRTGTVVQIVLWDGKTPWGPSNELNLKKVDENVHIGDVLTSNQKFERPVVVPPVPDEISMRQFRLELDALELFDDVETMVAMGPRSFKIEWETATVIGRLHPLVEALGTQLNMTSEQIDNLFRNAIKR